MCDELVFILYIWYFIYVLILSLVLLLSFCIDVFYFDFSVLTRVTIILVTFKCNTNWIKPINIYFFIFFIREVQYKRICTDFVVVIDNIMSETCKRIWSFYFNWAESNILYKTIVIRHYLLIFIIIFIRLVILFMFRMEIILKVMIQTTRELVLEKIFLSGRFSS